MAYAPRYAPQPEEMVTPKQREALQKRKSEYLDKINKRLDGVPDSPEKTDLIEFRDHCMHKFPALPVDLSIWVIAYFDDWNRRADQLLDMIWKEPTADES